MSKNFKGNIHPLEQKRHDAGLVEKQHRRLARREARKKAKQLASQSQENKPLTT